MKSVQLLISTAILISLTACAGLPFGGTSRSDEEELALLDPVAHAARKYQRTQVPSYRKETGVIESAIANRDIIRGMTREEVTEAWGTPHTIEPAGTDGNGNERWIYSEGLSSQWSVSTARILYFEDGHLAGWETLAH